MTPETKKFYFQCRTGEIFQEGQAAVIHRCVPNGSDLMQVSQHKSLEEKQKEARDPRSDVYVRQDFCSFLADYMYRDHFVPRTNFYVRKDDFPIPLKKATIDDDWNMDEPWKQDPDIFVQKNRQSCRKDDKVKPSINGLKKNTARHLLHSGR